MTKEQISRLISIALSALISILVVWGYDTIVIRPLLSLGVQA